MSFQFSFQIMLLLVSLTFIFISSTTAVTNLPSPLGSDQCHYPTKWFTQVVDHFGNHAGTFQQKFYMSTEFFQAGGPILLFQGLETTSLDCIEATIMYNFARELHGIAVALEHRYFGESVPFGSNYTEYTNGQWKYLSLDNVVQDAVSFIDSIKTNITAAKDSPVFAASGSYGAFLMTVFRQNQPKTFTGVIASAPPLRAFFGGNDTNVVAQYSWWDYVSRLYQEQSLKAAGRIQNAFEELAERFTQNNLTSIQHELGLCNPISDNSTTTLETLVIALRLVYSNGAQFNYGTVRPGRSVLANPLTKFIDIALEEETALEILNRTNWAWYSASAASAGIPFDCFDQNNLAVITQLADPSLSRVPFDYIVCTYLSVDSTSTDNNTIFLPTGNPAALHAGFVKICQQEYGLAAPSSEELYTKYHLTDTELQNSSGIMFSIGEYDPTSAVSGLYDFAMPISGHEYASRRIYTSGMAHYEDLFAWDEHTRANVRATNAAQLEVLRSWSRLDSWRSC